MNINTKAPWHLIIKNGKEYIQIGRLAVPVRKYKPDLMTRQHAKEVCKDAFVHQLTATIFAVYFTGGFLFWEIDN